MRKRSVMILMVLGVLCAGSVLLFGCRERAEEAGTSTGSVTATTGMTEEAASDQSLPLEGKVSAEQTDEVAKGREDATAGTSTGSVTASTAEAEMPAAEAPVAAPVEAANPTPVEEANPAPVEAAPGTGGEDMKRVTVRFKEGVSVDDGLAAISAEVLGGGEVDLYRRDDAAREVNIALTDAQVNLLDNCSVVEQSQVQLPQGMH